MTDGTGWTSPGGPGEDPRTSAPTPPYGPPGWTPAGWAPPPAPPRPGVVPLRPLGLGEILDGAVTYIRRLPRPTLGLSVIVALVLLVVQSLSLLTVLPELSLEETVTEAGGTDTGAESDLGLNLIGLVQTLLQQGVVLVATGMLTFVMGQAVLGRVTTMRESWNRVRPRILPLIGLGVVSLLLIVLAVLVPCLPGIVLLVAGQTLLGAILLVLGVIAGFVLAVWVYLNLVLAPSALVLEHVGVRSSLRRGRDLLRGGFWRVLGTLLLATIISFFVGGLFGVFFGLIGTVLGAVLSGADAAFVAGLVGYTLGTVIGAVVTVPFEAGVRSLLYIDQRMRREGFDLVLARATSAAPAPGAPGPGAPDAPEPRGQQW